MGNTKYYNAIRSKDAYHNKREMFAASALIGLLSSPHIYPEIKLIEECFNIAERMIDESERRKDLTNK